MPVLVAHLFGWSVGRSVGRWHYLCILYPITHMAYCSLSSSHNGDSGGGGGGGRGRMTAVDLDYDKAERDILLSGALNLVEIHSNIEALAEASPSSYDGVLGVFCQVNFATHKKDPSSVPMFRHLVEASPGCTKERYQVSLKDLATKARAHDAEHMGGVPKALKISGVVFHESRCGSTLVANSLIAMNPEKHRVYSESAPPIMALRGVCGEDFQHCSTDQAAALLRDVMYVMSRTDSAKEERVFFKIQSVGSRSIKVFQKAFPNVPWIFVYRDPVQVMMSQLEQGTKVANCVRPRVRPPTIVSDLLINKGSNAYSVTDEGYCAAHLATITQSAVDALNQAPELGAAVNYKDLPHILYEQILPNHFNIPVTEQETERIQKISGVYSKGVGDRKGFFHQDSARKEKAASREVRNAAAVYLQESFDELEQFRAKYATD